MSDLAAETRRLLDAIELPATATKDERLAAIQSYPIGCYVKVGHPHNGEVFRRVEVKPGQMAGLVCLGYHRENDAGRTALQRVTSWADREFRVELIAAAPRLLANWLARNEQTEAVEDDLGRIANENAALAGRLMAERDRLADENRALRAAIDRAVSYLKSNSDANGNGLDGFDVRLVASNLAISLDAAADRGVTPEDRNEGDKG